MELLTRIRGRLAAPVDIAGLVWFRVVFGLVIAWEMTRYLGKGWVQKYWVEPEFLVPYPPFDFVKPWPEPWMSAHVVAVMVAAVGVAAGWRYKVVTWVVFVGFAWLFLLDQTRYLNHFYLATLIAFVMTLLPADRAFSLDAASGRVERSETTPAWSLWLARFMVGVPYFFGGVAKLHSDWLHGEPMRSWLAGETDYPIIGRFFESEAAVAFFVGGGLLFDLLVVPLLLIRRTRALGLILMLSFHLLNCRMFKIGMFPWLMMLLTLVYLPSDWPRRVWADLTGPDASRRTPLLVGGALGMGIGATLPSQPDPVNAIIATVGVAVVAWDVSNYGWDFGRQALPEPDGTLMGARSFAFVAAFALVQITLPWRHLFIPGDVHWTEEGHRWAWHMKLRDKDVERAMFVVHPRDGEPYDVDPRRYLARHQRSKVMQTPAMVVLLARHILEDLGEQDAEITVHTMVRLNGREPQLLIDPNQDLSRIPVPWVPPARWILPLEQQVEVVSD